MVNHSCDPNCIKFAPKPGSLGASEIYATRAIGVGDEITICYCSPIEMTQHSMRNYLQRQHRFQCKCAVCLPTFEGKDKGLQSVHAHAAYTPMFPLLDRLIAGVSSTHLDVDKFTEINAAAMHYSNDVPMDLDQLQEELEKVSSLPNEKTHLFFNVSILSSPPPKFRWRQSFSGARWKTRCIV